MENGFDTIWEKAKTDGISIGEKRGISIGDELEYTDEVTLGRSILNRIPFSK